MAFENYYGKVMELFNKASLLQLGLAAAVGYLALVRTLRYRRAKEFQTKLGYKSRDDFKNMTANEAHEIVLRLIDCEFPFITYNGLQFALFKTYGIPSISKLLVKTKQLSNKDTAPRRLVDTAVLIGEFIGFAPDSDRAISAISRMNYLHSLYQKQGLISNDDMLYTLSLFALEPVRWVERFEWRNMTDLEICASGTFWKSFGDAMGISYADLPSSKTGWRDGLEWYQEVETWSNAYEERAMVPDKANHQTAVETTAILLWDVPKPLHPLGEGAVSTLMDDRLRKAMIYPEPAPWLKSTLLSIFWVRKYLLRYLALPRPFILRSSALSENPNEQGLNYRTVYETEPWYVPDTFYNRWISPKTWFKWSQGLPTPGKQWRPEGYDISHVGPRVLEGKGLKEWTETRDKLMHAERGGCPFAINTAA